MSILDTIANSNRRLVAEQKRTRPLKEVQEAAVATLGHQMDFPFEKALRGDGVSLIAECKKASPSRGLIAPNYPYVSIARSYEVAGAAAISCLTEPRWFHGSIVHLRDIAAAVRIPVLRKDFVVDPYQIYEAREAGAAAVLLICAILEEAQLREFMLLARSLGLSALVEAHGAEEIATALRCGAQIIGVNNRDLRDFSVNPHHAARLHELVPPGVIFVAESGIHTGEDVAALMRDGVDAVLVGEALMTAPDRTATIRELLGR
ncbi:indole-3-glycerol phosphate synthase TrpC [Neoactinobaculum massilliense]|uniref:indole-3-glycerol phosphate synthase TrpC n=1 Tax=Neoactinobaculum massilliense TaxID=2364794 RepID=UPI000F51E096|nr:indole-3-glycerol phosphate synthase TrpC [Neoactinobaculum massilliense]